MFELDLGFDLLEYLYIYLKMQLHLLDIQFRQSEHLKWTPQKLQYIQNVLPQNYSMHYADIWYQAINYIKVVLKMHVTIN